MKKAQLFLLHFAGGNSYSFRFLERWLPDFELVPLELPGRGKRIGEPLLREFTLAVRDIFRQVTARYNNGHFLLYGHSMGAYLALSVTSMLEKTGRMPACLIVSGNAGPGMYDPQRRYLMEREPFITELKRLGGIPPEILENEELFNFFDPVLRADFEIAERNNAAATGAVNTPLFAMMGSQEEKSAEIDNWRKFTRSRFGYRILEGNHFFIHDHPQQVADIIRSCHQYSSF
ncbi:thioesterase II family protein [Chitinophaga sp. Cy-1792]|uniref:thioesterase II family protein n=1 Tax=Chitinophaga sp. Cy-1792 TaxID=2608339 RepID=UPI00141D9DDE|nr:alpha/beta fold hydrolase [Chitinophaga sp. Cy-1792]NIG56801.1 thioesterase [Chitinophaga sp. Cy-1792]